MEGNQFSLMPRADAWLFFPPDFFCLKNIPSQLDDKLLKTSSPIFSTNIGKEGLVYLKLQKQKKSLWKLGWSDDSIDLAHIQFMNSIILHAY